jgi:NAD(P)-dependent dehydrogenase (short-subunit alcohol dehydrogenase family)
MGAYCAAKAGVVMLTEVAALELGPAGVRCNAIAPGLVTTPATEPLRGLPGVIDEYLENTPLGRAATPDEIAGVAAFLASGEAGFVNGAVVAVDGGARTRRYPDVVAGIERMLGGG